MRIRGKEMLVFRKILHTYQINDPRVYFKRFTEQDIYSNQPSSRQCLFLYPFETSENLWFSDVFSGYRKRLVACNRLISIEKSGLNRTEAAIGGAL